MSSNRQLLKEFWPSLRFLMIFVGIYLTGNILYGIWIERWRPLPDPMTEVATRQTAYLLRTLAEPISFERSSVDPVVILFRSEKLVLRIFEGCNGINVMIVFVAFLVAFKGKWTRMAVFGIFGLGVIHVANLLRLVLLYFMAVYQPTYFYYFHKYLFTAVLYAVVFALWFFWMRWAGMRESDIAGDHVPHK